MREAVDVAQNSPQTHSLEHRLAAVSFGCCRGQSNSARDLHAHRRFCWLKSSPTEINALPEQTSQIQEVSAPMVAAIGRQLKTSTKVFQTFKFVRRLHSS